MKNDIRIIDWAGNLLYEGSCDSPKVDHVLDVNRCSCKEGCPECGDTGYQGDFRVEWCDPDREENVYEWINY